MHKTIVSNENSARLLNSPFFVYFEFLSILVSCSFFCSRTWRLFPTDQIFQRSFRFMVAAEKTCEGRVRKKRVYGLYPDKVKEYEISGNIRWIKVDAVDDLECPPVPDGIDLRKEIPHKPEKIHRKAESPYIIKDNRPGMPGLDRILLAVVHTSQTVLAVVSPVRARILFALHDDSTVRARLCTQPASDAFVGGEHDLSHKKAAYEQIKDREKRSDNEKEYPPEIFP